MEKKEKEKWRKSYNNKKNPPHWAVYMEPSKLLTRDFLGILKKEKIGKGKILDIGCGNGRDSIFLAKSGYKVVGIDITPKAITLANKNKRDLIKNKIKKKNLKFVIANAEKIPFKDGYFDSVYSAGVLHCTNLNKSLKEAVRVLKYGGAGIIHLWEKTLMVKNGKIIFQVPAEKAKNILSKLPVKILNFKNNITTGKIDYDEGKKNAHKHYAIIFSFKKIKKPQSEN